MTIRIMTSRTRGSIDPLNRRAIAGGQGDQEPAWALKSFTKFTNFIDVEGSTLVPVFNTARPNRGLAETGNEVPFSPFQSPVNHRTQEPSACSHMGVGEPGKMRATPPLAAVTSKD